MKHLTTRMLAIIVALLASLSMMLAIVSLPHLAYAVGADDGSAQGADQLSLIHISEPTRRS